MSDIQPDYLREIAASMPADADHNAYLALIDAADLIESLARRASSAESDIANAVKCAKEYCPDYPWQQTESLASEAVWATGEGYKGVSKACDDLRAHITALTSERDEAIKNYKAQLDIAANFGVTHIERTRERDEARERCRTLEEEAVVLIRERREWKTRAEQLEGVIGNALL